MDWKAEAELRDRQLAQQLNLAMLKGCRSGYFNTMHTAIARTAVKGIPRIITERRKAFRFSQNAVWKGGHSALAVGFRQNSDGKLAITRERSTF